MSRYIAHFQPEAWVCDNAVAVDDEGPDTWDCTEEMERLDLEERPDDSDETKVNLVEVEDAIDQEGYWLDENDYLKRDPNAPLWVREWGGPFTITVQRKE